MERYCHVPAVAELKIVLHLLLYPVYTIQPVVNVGCQTRFDTRVERTATVRSTGCQTGLYNRLYTRYNRLANRFDKNRFDNQFDNRLYRVNGALQFSHFGGLGSVTLSTYEYNHTRCFVHVFTLSTITFINRSLQVCHIHGGTSSYYLKPYRCFLSDKYHNGMQNGRCRPKCMQM